jgi:hypothetical protein
MTEAFFGVQIIGIIVLMAAVLLNGEEEISAS